MNTIKLSTPCGDILGIDTADCYEFRGIRYAVAGRWEYPALVTDFGTLYDATEFGACSYQRRGFEKDEDCNPFYHKEFIISFSLAVVKVVFVGNACYCGGVNPIVSNDIHPENSF